MEVKLQSKDGVAGKYKPAGIVYVNVKNPTTGDTSQIAVEVEHSTGTGRFRTEHKREAELVYITFEDGTIWSGTMADLQAKLTTPEIDVKPKFELMSVINDDDFDTDYYVLIDEEGFDYTGEMHTLEYWKQSDYNITNLSDLERSL